MISASAVDETIHAAKLCYDRLPRLFQLLAIENISRDNNGSTWPIEVRNQVLRLLAGGYSNREISQLLDITDGTVKNHISSVLSKLGVRDRTRAVLKAIDNGYI